MERKKLAKVPLGRNATNGRDPRAGWDAFAAERRYGALRARSLLPGAPASLRTFSVGAAQPMSVVRAASVDKLEFEALRALLRERCGFPLTQPGAFGALVRLGRRRRAELVRVVAVDLAGVAREMDAAM